MLIDSYSPVCVHKKHVNVGVASDNLKNDVNFN